MAKAYSYQRWSSSEQSKGTSAVRQTSLTEAFCKRHGLDLDSSTFLDAGVSGFRGKNATVGALAAFLKLVQQGSIEAGSYLVLEKLDRLGRQDLPKVFPIFTGLIDAGIIIATVEPERIYDKSGVDGFLIIEPILQFILANQESAKKAERSRFNWNHKRKNADKVKLTAACPYWLTLNKTTQAFELVPHAIEALKLIFDLANQGFGYTAITTHLNTNKVRTYGKSKLWDPTYIQRLLTDRRLLGEFRPRSTNDEGRKVRTGEVIKGYYPEIIPTSLFYQVQNLIQKRKSHRGRIGQNIANLFTGLLFDARDGSPMTLTGQKLLVSSAAVLKRPNTLFLGFRYAWLEQALLYDLFEALPHMNPQPTTHNAQQLEDIRTQLAEKQDFLQGLKDKLRTSHNIATFAELVVEAEGQIRNLQAQEQKLLGEMSVVSERTYADLFALIEQAKTDKSQAFRSKLKTAISRSFDKSYVLIFRTKGKTTCLIQLHPKGQATPRQIAISTTHKSGKFVIEVPPLHQKLAEVGLKQIASPVTPYDLRFYPYLDETKTAKWPEAALDKVLLAKRQKTAKVRNKIK